LENAGTSKLPEGVKAQRVFLSLRDKITSGQFSDGENLPGEQRLAESFGVSRVTVRRALDTLSDVGLIEKRPGSGSRVRPQPQSEQRASLDFNTLMPQLVEMGQSTSVRLLSFSYDHAPDYVARVMGAGDAEKMQIATRIRIADGIPFSHLTTFVPAAIAQNYSENDLATNPLFTLLERSGVQITDAHQSVSATLAGPEVAEALDIAVGSALLSLNRIVNDKDGKAVEYLTALYRPDMFRLEMPLSRVGRGKKRHWELAIGQTNGSGT